MQRTENRSRLPGGEGGDYNPGNQNRPFLAVNYNARTLLVLNLSIMIDNSYNLVGGRRAIDNINCTYVD